MPPLIELRLKATWTVHPDTRQLHGLACALFETDPAAHARQDKPFAVWPLSPVTDSLPEEWILRVAWLPDDSVPDAARMADQLRVGRSRCLVAESTQRRVTHASLAAGPPLSAVTVGFASPTYY